MPVYRWKHQPDAIMEFCDLALEEHLSIAEYDRNPHRDCEFCAIGMIRDYSSVQIAPVMQEHYNPTTGTLESDPKRFGDTIKRQEDSMAERLGYDQSYVQVDPSDPAIAPTE